MSAIDLMCPRCEGKKLKEDTKYFCLRCMVEIMNGKLYRVHNTGGVARLAESLNKRGGW